MLELRFGERSVAGAWRSTMSGIDLNLLYGDWTSINVRYPTIALGFEVEDPPAAIVRPMTEAEVELHLAARWDWNDEVGRTRAIEHLDRSIKLDPNAPEAYLVRAAISDATGAEAQAAAWLSRAIDLAPEDPSVLRSELVFRFKEPEVPLKTNRDTEDVAMLLEDHATTAAQCDALARYYLESKNDTMEARYWAARTLRRDPSCAACRVTAGDVLSAAGQPTLAASMYRRALNLSAHDPVFDRESVLASMQVSATAAP